jgi:hypothetical protein
MPSPSSVARLVPAARLASITLVALLVAACATSVTSSPREWTTTFERTDGSGHAIRVTDASGRIEEVEVDPAGVPVPETVEMAPGSDRTLLVPWTGGSCDAMTAIDISAFGSTTDVAIAVTPGAQVCDAMAVGHVVALRFNDPVSPDQVTVQR